VEEVRGSVGRFIGVIVASAAVGCAASGPAPRAPADAPIESDAARHPSQAPEFGAGASPAPAEGEASPVEEPADDLAVEEFEYELLDEELDDAFLEDDFDPAERDPFERGNRRVFGFNQWFEKFILDPVSDGYEFVVPAAGRRAIHRAFLNLNSTSVLVNDLLQLRPQRAGVTGSRFVINTTVGLVGLFDVAIRLGLERHHSDFGQTLARAGVPSGPYLVLPIFGPATARNAFGNFTDGLFQPYFYLLGPTEFLVIGAGSGLATRDASRESIEALRATSVDFYAAMRIAYFLYREKLIEHEN
jgi:phospholipid-binding lipoprotein MlaA